MTTGRAAPAERHPHKQENNEKHDVFGDFRLRGAVLLIVACSSRFSRSFKDKLEVLILEIRAEELTEQAAGAFHGLPLQAILYAFLGCLTTPSWSGAKLPPAV